MSLESRRLDLQSRLEEILGSRNVYFQPPASISLSYPCIVYSFEGEDTLHSNNVKYKRWYRYSVVLITKNPFPTDLLEALSDTPYSRFDREYQSDNLHHFAYTVILDERN